MFTDSSLQHDAELLTSCFGRKFKATTETKHIRVSDVPSRLTTYLYQFKGKAFMKDAIDSGPPRQLQCVHLVSRALDSLLKVHSKLLDHPSRKENSQDRSFCGKLCFLKRHLSYMYLLGEACHSVQVGLGVLWESDLSCHYVSLGDKYLGISLGSKHVYPLSQLVSPVDNFLVFYILLFLKTGSCFVIPGGPELKTFMPKPPKC